MGISKASLTAVSVGRRLLAGVNLAALSMVGRPKDLVTYVGESLLLCKSLAQKRGIPQRNVYEILRADDGIEQITLGNLSNGGAWLTPVASYATDIISLCLICRMLRPKKIFEIGTLTGYTSFHFALNTPDSTEIFSLDLPKQASQRPALNTDLADDRGIERHARANAYCFENSPVSNKITLLFGDSGAYDFAPFHGQIDFFFIDGAHSYEYVRSDTLNALQCCHSGSVIAWHDFGRMVVSGVHKWVTEFARQQEVYSVPGGSLAFSVIK
jgi:predicted O-methyltransferase YrrM